jgi:hypothetical protein
MFPLLTFAVVWVLILATWRVANLIYGTSISWAEYFSYKDGGWYFQIIKYGYGSRPQNPAFFPLLPALVRGASHLTAFTGTERYLWAALVVQVLAGAASCVAIWALAARVTSRRIADRAVILYCAFPGAMTFGMLYAEPLGIALAAACLLAALNRKWLLAGVLGFLATAEHPTWLLLAPVLGIVSLREIWTRGDWRSLTAPVLTPLGMLTYFAWIGTRLHDYLIWFHVERRFWGTHFDFGVRTFRLVTWTYPPAAQYHVFNILLVISFAVAVVGCVLMIRARVPLAVSLYTVGLFVYLVMAQEAAKPRFYWCLFGIFIGAAAKLPRWLFWSVAIASAGLLAFCVGWWPHQHIGPAP